MTPDEIGRKIAARIVRSPSFSSMVAAARNGAPVAVMVANAMKHFADADDFDCDLPVLSYIAAADTATTLLRDSVAEAVRMTPPAN